MPSTRYALYASPIQHVLVLQEEDPPEGEIIGQSRERRGSILRVGDSDDATLRRRDVPEVYPWRIASRTRTVNGALVLCLNIGVDPPDVIKPNPCARLECWEDPNLDNPGKSLQKIAGALRGQYEQWHAKAKYKVCADPTSTELKKICVSLRRAAKDDERVLFHYNGHGVPKPTGNGEIWVFNQNYTQYIPLNLYDLRDVLGSPSLLVFDCNSAGIVQYHFKKMTEQLEREWQQSNSSKSEKSLPYHRNSVFLGACSENELLPTNPRLPADVFTACLTTPIKMLLLWFCQRTLISGITPDMLDRIPGNLSRRQTPLGEFNWIFTAVTDAIAWNVLPREKFKLLYRQDLLLASLMRNFLLAHRILRSYGCTPVSFPEIPETHTHPLWQACDLAVEQLLSQLPNMIAPDDAKMNNIESGATEPMAASSNYHGQTVGQGVYPTSDNRVPRSASEQRQTPSTPTSRRPPSGRVCEGSGSSAEHSSARSSEQNNVYIPSTFFEDQMKAFDVWLDMGPDQRDPPEQLPIMLQALLSPSHRVKVLPLLSKYMQTGPIAVDLVLSVGIFPYVQQLLRSKSAEMRQDLVFIWSKILALDDTCRTDLVKDKGEDFFVRFLNQCYGPDNPPPKPVYIAVAMFVLSVVAKGYADRCYEVGTLGACFRHLGHEDKFVRRWACLCLTVVIRNVTLPLQSELLAWDEFLRLLRRCAIDDPAPDVRAAATSTLSAIMGGVLKRCSPHFEARGCTSRNEYQPSNLTAESGNVRGGRTLTSSVSLESNVSTQLGIGRRSPRNMERSRGQVPLQSGTEVSRETNTDFKSEERDALLKVGAVITEIGKKESSVLVRREVAIAIARAARYQLGKFVRAAVHTDIMGVDDSQGSIQRADVEKCEQIYRKMWVVLSELAFDPHPVVAALARRSYDMITEPLSRRDGLIRNWVQNMARADIPPTDHAFSPPENAANNAFMKNDSLHFAAIHRDSMLDGSPSAQNNQEQSVAPSQDGELSGTTRETRTNSGTEQHYHATSPQATETNFNTNTAAEEDSVNVTGQTGSLGGQKSKCAITQSRSVDVQVPTGSIHVRSTSGSFDLKVSSRLPSMSTMPRVHSASLIPPVSESPDMKGMHAGRVDNVRSSPSLDRIAQTKNDGPRSLPKIALARGVGMLMKTFSEQLPFPVRGNASNTLPRSLGSTSSVGTREDKEELEVKPSSPPRPPKRSLSYQVLNAASTLSPSGEIPIHASSRPTYFATAETDVSDESLGKFFKKLPRGYERLYLSGHGDAALSLYEWSSAYIARVEFDGATTDSIHEGEAVPRYAALWDKFLKTSGKIPSESLRAFALLGEGANGMGIRTNVPDDDEGKGLKFSEISTYAMGAGGGAVMAMAFLPRDIGMGDDQLIATGDNTGSVGVYDTRSGSCQGSFGIPFPPGIPEVGVSSILCLNRPTPTAWDSSLSLGNSRSALILAGAYDGRVAVFKSDLQGQKYRIMSTFQASGQSYWSKVGTSREPRFKPSEHNIMNGTQLSPESSAWCLSGSVSFADTVRESGNGLVLAFDSDSSYLAAAGCDKENVRVWDLSREQCIWEGASVVEGTWPTAITMWGRINRNVFVVGASDGRINVVDLRERGVLMRRTEPLVRMGKLAEPIISLGTCPPVGKYAGEVVVSADIGGQIAFWDARWNSTTGVVPGLSSDPELSRIKAHRSNLTAMAVHPLGTMVASGSTARCVKVFGPNRNMLKMLCSHETGNGLSEADNRIPPVTSLSFQPESNLLAIGAVDSSVMIYGQPDSFPGVQAREDQVTEAERAALYEYWR